MSFDVYCIEILVLIMIIKIRTIIKLGNCETSSQS